MRGSLRFTILFLAVLCLLRPDAVRAEDGPDTFITRAAFAQGRLWVLTYAGSLFSISEHENESRLEALDGEVRDICVLDGRVVAVVGPRWGRGSWTVRSRGRGGWVKVARVPARREGLIGINCDSTALLLTTNRLIDLGNGTPRSVALSDMLRPSRIVSALHADRDYLHVGLNAGEWGGGLRRIDRVSGEVVTIEPTDSKARACDGWLNSNCHPVHAIEQAPWKPKCLIAAIGLVHFFPDGRLLEICGERVDLHYSNPVETGTEEEGQPFSSSEAFFGLARAGDTLWAVGTEGVYRLHASGEPEKLPFPKFRRLGHFRVSFEFPGIVLLVTEVNARASVSGRTPMLIPR